MMFLGRVLAGVGVGYVYILFTSSDCYVTMCMSCVYIRILQPTLAVYIAEISPKNVRGKLIALSTLFASFGLLVGDITVGV